MMGYVTTESHKMLYKDKELLPLMMMIKYLLKGRQSGTTTGPAALEQGWFALF